MGLHNHLIDYRRVDNRSDNIFLRGEIMKTYADLQDRLKIELIHWFSIQCRENETDFHLYYTETIPGKDGSIMIARNAPNPEWKLAMPERINKGATIEQNFNHIVLTCLSKLPVLSS